MKKIDTYLPLFPGFYCTIFEPDETIEIDNIERQRAENGVNDLPDDFDFLQYLDYEQYRNDTAESFNDALEAELVTLGFVSGMDFQEVISPKYYNFSNDSVNVEIKLSPENEKNIRKYLLDHKEEFERYIKERYTSRDGFISHYSNDSDDWLSFELDENGHVLGTLLEFICGVEGISVDELYYFVESYLQISDNQTYIDLSSRFYCAECESFVDEDHFHGPLNVCDDCVAFANPCRLEHIGDIEGAELVETFGLVDIYKKEGIYIAANWPLINRIDRVFTGLHELKNYYQWEQH